MNNNKIKIGIAGLGTVGSGVINLLEKNKVEILKRSGFEISIVCVSASNKDKKRNCNIEGLSFYTNPLEMIRNESIDILIELIGGEGLAKELVIEALKKKIHVVTANKALIALPIASAAAVPSSSIEELDISIPVRSEIIVWKFINASNRPWEISGW